MAIFIAWMGLPPTSAEANAASRFVFVAFDKASASKFGDFPSRAGVAKLLAVVNEGAPKAVALKFFYDSPIVDTETKQLIVEMAKGRVLLQASVNPEPPQTGFLNDRFYFTGSLGGVSPEISGVEGWLPNPEIAQNAHKVCFADVVRPERIPMLVRFQGRIVKSLYACLLEEAFDASVIKLEPRLARFGRHALAIDTTGSSIIKLNSLTSVETISALDIAEGRVDKDKFRGKVVIIIYTGKGSPVVEVGNVKTKIHQVFAAQLRELENALYLVKN